MFAVDAETLSLPEMETKAQILPQLLLSAPSSTAILYERTANQESGYEFIRSGGEKQYRLTRPDYFMIY